MGIIIAFVIVLVLVQLIHNRKVKNVSATVENNLNAAQETFLFKKFTPTSEYSLESHFESSIPSKDIITFKFYVDTKSKRIAFSYLRQGRIDFIEFNKIIGYDVIVDGQTMSSNSIGGGIIGNSGIGIGIAHSTSKNKIEGISFKINLNDTNSPNYIIPLVANEEVDTTSQFYKKINMFIEQMKSVLDTIIRDNDHNYNFTVSKATVVDDLKEYKDLYDSGTITQEEFDAMKKKLLDL